MKKASIILALAVLMVALTAGTAFANFGPHGGYALDTDACAGCHRAHTSFSTVTWADSNNNSHSALLVSSAATMQEFCYACHGDAAPGASTNVQSGVFDSGPSGYAGQAVGGGILYATNSSFDATLNGGGFDRVPSAVGFASTTSMHDMGKGAATDPMWGAGSSAPVGADLTCTSCHDPHGSSNYRLLKDQVNGHTVGGYVNDVPQPFVFSAETNYPTSGWLKHDPGASQMTTYTPNYTTAIYKFVNGDVYSAGAPRSMSTWCSACHEQYNVRSSAYSYGGYEAADATRNAGGLVAGVGTSIGMRVRHRHPVNVPIATVTQANGWGSDAITSSVLPLEKRPGALAGETTWTSQDYLGCLTCHRAHGTAAQMSGWAVSSLNTSASKVPSWYPEKVLATVPSGVNPNFSSAMLRSDNRGVCERCHNK